MTNAELLAKIKAEIERRIHETNNDITVGVIESGIISKTLRQLLSFLDTLESEKPNDPEGLDEAAKEYEHNRVFESELENYSIYLDSLEDGEEPKMKEPSKDAKYLLNADVIDAFIAGAKWGAEHSGGSEIQNDWKKAADKEYPYEEGMDEHMLDLNAQKQAAFFKGAKWDMEQMMKEAVEKTVCLVPSLVGPKMFTTSIELSADELKGFNFGDKVRIIILPKENEK